MRYCVTVNVPGYSPIDGGDVDFDSIQEAREELATQLHLSREEPEGGRPMPSREALSVALDEAKGANVGDSVIFAGYAHTIGETESPIA